MGICCVKWCKLGGIREILRTYSSPLLSPLKVFCCCAVRAHAPGNTMAKLESPESKRLRFVVEASFVR